MKTLIILPIHGICGKIETLTIRKRRLWIYITWWKSSIWELWALTWSPGNTGVNLWRAGIGSSFGFLCSSGAHAHDPLHLQRVHRFLNVPFWQGSHPSVWSWRSITWCLSPAIFTCICARKWTPRFLYSGSWLWVVLGTVLDCHFRPGSGSKPNRCQIGGPGCQETSTVN